MACLIIIGLHLNLGSDIIRYLTMLDTSMTSYPDSSRSLRNREWCMLVLRQFRFDRIYFLAHTTPALFYCPCHLRFKLTYLNSRL